MNAYKKTARKRLIHIAAQRHWAKQYEGHRLHSMMQHLEFELAKADNSSLAELASRFGITRRSVQNPQRPKRRTRFSIIHKEHDSVVRR